MISHKDTLTSPDQIDYIFKKGKRYFSKYFRITILTLREDEKPRVLCMISKKIAKKAYQRNLIRRRTYSLVVQNKEYFSKNHVIIFPKVTVETLPFEELQRDFVHLVKQIN